MERPAVVARLQGGEPEGWLRLGVPLPPAEGKQRLALVAPVDAVHARCEPVTLDDARAGAPTDWHAPLDALSRIADDVSLTPSVFGAFAWQAITGEAYVHEHSDIDLLWRPRHRGQLPALFEALAHWERDTGRRADGELLWPDGSGTNWRELADADRRTDDRALLKQTHGCRLLPREAVLAAWPPVAH